MLSRVSRNRAVLVFLLLISLVTPASDTSAATGDLGERLLTGHTGEIFALAFSPDDRLLASGSGDNVIRLWDYATGREVRSLRGHVGAVRAVAFSPDGRQLISGGSDNTIRVWDAASGQEQKALPNRFGATRAVAVSPDGQWIATGGDDGTVRIWDWAAGRETKAMKGRAVGIVFAVKFSPDGKTIASGGSDNLLHIWDLASGLERSTLSGHQGQINGISFSADGNTVATAASDSTVRLWDLSASRERSVFSGHAGGVQAVVFWPDGRAVASAGVDGTVRIWDLSTGNQRTTLAGHTGPVWAIALTSDGSLLATGGRDQRIVVRPPTTSMLSTLLAEKIKQRGNETGPAPSPPPLPSAELLIQPAEAKAGADVTFRVNLTNKGRGPVYRLQATTKSGDQAFNGQVFYFGKIDSGQSVNDAVTIHVPADRGDAQIPVEIVFEEYNGFTPDTLKAVVNLKGAPRPRFAYTHQVIDDGTGNSVGNGDGRIQKGEAVDLLLTIKNVGTVAAKETSVEITGPAVSGLIIRDNAQNLGILNADESKNARVNLLVRKDLSLAELPLRLFIRDRASNALVDEELKLAVDVRPAPQVVATNKIVIVKEAAAKIRSGAGAETSIIASAGKDQQLAVSGELAEWYRVQISERETGWIAKREVSEAPLTAKGEMPVPTVSGPAVVKVFQNAPPVIAIAAPSDGQEITADRVQLMGAAASEKGVAAVEIRINGQLLTRRDNRGIAVRTVGAQPALNLEFSERVGLREGKNEIVVTAIDRENLSSTRTLSVTRNVDRGKIWAVVIGISQYKMVRSLKFADQDALGFYNYLVSQIGVPKEQITLLTNADATLLNLKRVLGTELRRKAGEKDTVIIYYAGHGAPESDATSSDDDGLEKYLVPYEGDPNDLYATGLPMREVETILQRLASERVIFITDSCYSGATAGRTFATASRRAVVSDAFLARLAKAKGRVVLTASRASEVSEERDALGHGVFTYYLLEGLRGKADLDGDGVITIDEIYNYVAQKVPEVTGQNQHPMKRGEVEGQLVLGRVR
jgi:WD40 repeat protein/uncharacterized protein YgiM (DUF1202 family)